MKEKEYEEIEAHVHVKIIPMQVKFERVDGHRQHRIFGK